MSRKRRKKKGRNPMAALLKDPRYKPKTEKKRKKEKLEEQMHKELKDEV